MKERERISNLEELMAENLMRLDKLENGQAELKFGQNVLLQSMTDLTKVVRKNSTDIEVLKSDVTILKDDVAYLKENMTTKQMFASLLDAVVNGFARNDRQFARMHDEMDSLRQDVDILKAR
jgi:predicted RNase H-like nuclease (RuvC/YqgF family)